MVGHVEDGEVLATDVHLSDWGGGGCDQQRTCSLRGAVEMAVG